MVEPKYTPRVIVTKLDAYVETLNHWLKADSGRGKRERRSKLHMWQELCDMGYIGSYARVCAYARLWKIKEGLAGAKAAFIPLKFKHGDWAQLNDWLAVQCKQAWSELNHPDYPAMKVADALQDEQTQLMPVPRSMDEYLPKVTRNRTLTFHEYVYGPVAWFSAIKFNQQKQPLKTANKGLPAVRYVLVR